MMRTIQMVGQTQGDCIIEERMALLEIKASHMKSCDSEIDDFLPTWVDYGSSTPADGGSDCCKGGGPLAGVPNSVELIEFRRVQM